MKTEHYVYLLYRDREETEPFYVGAGKGRRIFEHEREYLRGSIHINPRKEIALRECFGFLGYVPKSIFAAGLEREAALRLEADLIAWWGITADGTGCLTNAKPGDAGPRWIYPWTGKKKEKQEAVIKPMPIEAGATTVVAEWGSLSRTKPWLAAGVCQMTYYRWRKAAGLIRARKPYSNKGTPRAK